VPTPSRNSGAKLVLPKSDEEVLQRMARLKEQCEVLSESKVDDDSNSALHAQETADNYDAPKADPPARRRKRTESEIKEKMAARKAQCEVLGEGGGDTGRRTPISPTAAAASRIGRAFPDLAMGTGEGVLRRGTESSNGSGSPIRRDAVDLELQAMQELEMVKAQLAEAAAAE